MNTGGSVQHSFERVAEVLAPSLRSLSLSFGKSLARLRITAAQRRAIERITPGAAARACRSGVQSAGFLDQVRSDCRFLALSGAELPHVTGAIENYEKLSGPLYRKLPPGRRADAQAARHHLHSLLMLAVNQEFAAVEAAENQFLRELMQAEAASTNEPELAHAVLASLVRHFRAAEGAVFTQGTGGVRVLCSSAGEQTPAAVTPKSFPQRQIRKMKPDSRLTLAAEWRERAGSVWSVPVSGMVLQLYFDHDRPVLARESRLLQIVAETFRFKLLPLDRDDRLFQMLDAEELERRRIGRELHDDAGQSLVVIRLQLEMAELSIPEGSNELRTQLAEIRELTEKTILSVRKLISELSPAVLRQLGLAAAARQLVNRFQNTYPARLRLHIGELPPADPRLELLIYRILQECFTNIARHSAASRVGVSLTGTSRELTLKVEDNGVGFHPEEGLGRRNCYGLIGIRERVSLLGGTFAVKSTPANEGARARRGTKITAKLPITGKNLREWNQK